MKITAVQYFKNGFCGIVKTVYGSVSYMVKKGAREGCPVKTCLMRGPENREVSANNIEIFNPYVCYLKEPIEIEELTFENLRAAMMPGRKRNDYSGRYSLCVADEWQNSDAEE